MKFAIRTYRETDFETIYAIDQACYSVDIAYSRPELRWYLSLRGADCLVAETARGRKSRPGKIGGFIITERHKPHGHIVTIDVMKPFRRERLGTSLLRKAETRMRKHGVQEVWLETATNNASAIAFWRKRGYRTRGRLCKYYPGGLDAFAMSKQIAGTSAEEN